ncbi:MAG: HAMP domain-containing protein [Actinobacteria bacterium]|nr:HAMP domain-containing protein [Actinomycetota bacterium]
MRIERKLVVSYTLLAILTFLVTGLILRSSIAFFYTENLTKQLIAQAHAFTVAIDELGEDDLGGARTHLLINKLADSTDTWITLINTDGVVLSDTQAVNLGMMGNHANIPEVRQALSGEIGTSKRFSNTTKQDMLYVAVPYKTGGKIHGVIRIALPISGIDNALNKFSLMMLAIAIGATMLVVATSYKLSRSLTIPLKQMMQMAEQMASDNLEQRLPVERRDEIGALSKSLNNLAVKLKDRIDELRLEKAKVELIIDNMVDGILLLDGDGKIMLINPAAEQIFNVKAADTVGNPVIHSIRSYELDHAVHDSVSSRKEVIDDIESQMPFRRLRIRALPVADAVGERQTLVIIRDITRQKQVERLRKDFIANVSHELKTPLTGLKLLSETLLRSIDTDPSSSKLFIKRLDGELSKLINLVRKLIDLSKIETPQKVTEKAPVDLGELISEVGSSFYQLAANKGLSLTLDIAEGAPPVFGDKDQLLTLVRNLVDNAIRYTPFGGKINVKLEGVGDFVELAISDTGIGLAKREIPRIFERFYRVDKARSRETGSTGLGLSIVKHIAETHGASIRVDSSLGIGSTFTVSFPVNSPAASQKVIDI